ncbi:RNA polymerase sigma factor [Arcicella rosea]|uniref:RNA polymerase sigma-70 factor (ECF subfamily) n=1 Tax=Arcicella rosea TaxID=502909 RepID=A0A841EPG2_9BACT|nr:sigma-70 family RNA polymerase sigma factor [Arcicella rosea]MBB6002913.1 RNA polymerase sigma-70 factor (ECF subfamily) [Arcicella rosea]
MTKFEEDDVKLWIRFREGDNDAFTVIYNTYFKPLFHYGYHIAKDENLVKDCIHNLFVELWNSRSNLSDTTSIKFYLLRVMRRKVYRVLQKEGNYSDFLPDMETIDIVFSPELELISKQTEERQNNALQNAINQLSNRQKEAITLLYIEGLSYAEISEIMMLKVRSVYNLIHTALESLRKYLKQPGIWLFLSFLTH